MIIFQMQFETGSRLQNEIKSSQEEYKQEININKGYAFKKNYSKNKQHLSVEVDYFLCNKINSNHIKSAESNCDFVSSPQIHIQNYNKYQ